MIKGAKRPANDETFSSWLYRISVTRAAANYSAFLSALIALVSPYPAQGILQGHGKSLRTAEGSDIDYDMKQIQHVIYTHLADFHIKHIFFLPSNDLVVPCAMRIFYCPQCLREDVASIGFPYWRKSWTYCVSAYCFQHKRLLMASRANANSYDRAWSAFMEEMPATPLGAFRLTRDRLAIQVQRWYFERPGFSDLGLEHAQSSMELFELTYSLLLKCRTRFEDGGYACSLARECRGQIIQKSLPLSERIQTGVNISLPLQRAYALILTGTILGLVSPPQITRLVRLARQSGIPWPSTPFEIGKMAILYADREEYLALRELYSGTPAHLIARCAEFIRGLEHGVYSLRDEYSSQDRKWLQGGLPHQRWLVFPEE